MPKYTDSDNDSDDRYKKSKKKKKDRSRSRSSERKSSKHKKAKKSKSKRRSRSSSRSRRSTSRTRRSRSRSRTRRSRSRNRSRSNDRYSSRYSSRRRSRSSSRRRSRSRSRSRRRSTDRSNTTSRHASRSPKPKSDESDPLKSIPGFKDMNPSEQNKVRLHLALKAAADADQQLKDQGALPGDKLTSAEQAARMLDIEKIEKEGFNPSVFKSGRTNQVQQDSKSKLSSHDDAIFGHMDTEKIPMVTKPFVLKETDVVVHHSRCVDPEEKMKKWRQKLSEMRQAKLQGERM